MEEKEQEQVKKQQEKTKKKVNQSTLVYVVIIFILIIALMVVCYFGFLRKDESTQTNTTNTNTTANIVTNQNTVTTNVEQTNTTVNETRPVQEKGEELKISNSDVQKILEKFNFSESNVISSIYRVGEFNKTDIPNSLILRLGWYKLDNKKTTKDFENLRESVDAKFLKDSIYNVFGKDTKYQDQTFKYGGIDIFTPYATEDINYNGYNNKYEATIFQGGGGDIPSIHEEFLKAIKYDDEIKIYVKTAFINVPRLTDNNDFVYDIYSNYNFRKEIFENKLYTTTSTDFYKNYSYTNKLTENANTEISKIIDKLDTYVYTFTLDKDSGEYYFTAFNKE